MNKQPKDFGQFLQSLRKEKGFTLRAVENETGISNAYLSQLEQGKIKQPSPAILHKLSELYKVSYEELLALVGYPTSSSSKASRVSSRLGPITEDEEKSLLEYLGFIRSKKGK